MRGSRFTSDEIDKVLKAAGVSDDLRAKVQSLLATMRRPGRRPEPDSEFLTQVAHLVAGGKSPWAAAGAATASLPEPQRTTTRRRVYKKYNRMSESMKEYFRMTHEQRLQEARRRLAEASKLRTW